MSIFSAIAQVLSKPGQWCQSSSCCTVDVAVTPGEELVTAFPSSSSLGTKPTQTVAEIQKKLRRLHLQVARLKKDIQALQGLLDVSLSI